MTHPAAGATNTPSVKDAELHPRIAELIGALDEVRDELRQLIAAIPSAQRETVPAEGQWTVAQIVEHLAAVEDGAGRVVSKIIGGARAANLRDQSTESILGINDAFDIARTDRRIPAPDMVQPKEGLSCDAALARLETARERLKQVLRGASGLDLGGGSFPHPAFGPINGYQWALATAQHEQRHIRQIRRQLGIAGN